MTRDTLLLLQTIINGQQVPVSHPDFEQIAAQLGQAKRELAEALAEPDSDAQ